MVTQVSPVKKRQTKNGSAPYPDSKPKTKIFKTRENWPIDLEAAYRRYRGPYTVINATILLEEESLELFNGWLVWQEMTDPEERRIAANIQEILSSAARVAGFGQGYPDQLECEMVNEDVFKPDVCVISNERFAQKVQAIQAESEHLILKGSPEVVVEIRSPSNRRSQERKKRKIYFESGANIIWDVDPVKHKIWVYEVGDPDKGQEHTEQAEISCEPFLPGWKRKVADFFSKNLSAEQIVGQAATEWRAESRSEGRAEGELEALRKVILIQAQARYGKDLPNKVEERLNRCNSGELMELATLLATTNNLADWLKALPD